MLVLEVHEGVRRRSLMLETPQVRIGRERDCEVSLTGDPTISRVHAVLHQVGDGWELHDAGSRNGTYVNGQRVGQPYSMRPGDRILVGQFLLVVLDASDQAAETAPAGEAGPSWAQVSTGLSAREVEVLRLVCAGRSDKEIAETLVLSVKTVHSHLERIRDKSGCRRRPELVRYGMAHGLA